MPPSNRGKAPRQTDTLHGADADAAGDRTAAAYALMAEAERLYQRKRYRRAMAVCAQLAALDPKNAMPEQMIDGCRRELRKRKRIAIAAVSALAAIAGTLYLLHAQLVRLRIRPEPGTLLLSEGQTQTFQITSPLGYHKTLEYHWALLDGEGKPVPATEAGTLTRYDTTPWESAYFPPYSLVRGDSPRPALRRITVSGSDARGRQMVRAEWLLEISNVPLPPRLLSASPSPDRQLSIVAGQGAATFRVEAADGDGGTDLVYEWLVGEAVAHKGTEPIWTYRPPADALPPGRTGREPDEDPGLTVTCRITNRSGMAQAISVAWPVRLVRSNAPPQLIAFEPELSDLIRIKEGEARSITVKAYDPDPGETLSYTWQLDSTVVSRRPTCTLTFPPETTEREKRLTLRLTVADSCGATAVREWQVVVVDVPRPEASPR